jgi:branched-chain amino acid transport system substrate-binding protein
MNTMEKRIGILLPRSTDYPAMGFDLLDGLRCRLAYDGNEGIKTIPENIGFGEDKKLIYAKTEKLLLQDEVDCVVAYLSPANAAVLYPLMETAGKTLIVLDPGMSYPIDEPGKGSLHISLQGIHSSYLSGKKAAENQNDVILATSFYDGGYSGPTAHAKGTEDGGGAIVHNYISHYKESEFSVQPFMEAVREKQSVRVNACFSTYLASLFVNNLSAEQLPEDMEFYCSSFMAEEQTMATYTLPAAKFFAYIPWSSILDQEPNTAFKQSILQQKNKVANVFHLLGWEAGMVCARLFAGQGNRDEVISEMLQNWSYESPRGKVTFHPETRTTYGPLYFAEIQKSDDARTGVRIHDKIEVAADEHIKVLQNQPKGVSSGWFNNYLCT